jgi:hypothetical protein
VTLASGEVLRGRFVQQRFLQGFNAPLISSGSFVLAPGRGLIWRGEVPFALTIAISPDGLVQQVEGGATTRYPASRLPLISRLYEVFNAALTGDWKKLETAFQVRRDGADTNWAMTLTPRQNDAAMPIRDVVVRGRQYVDSVQLSRVNGDSERIEFSGQTVSRGPLDARESDLLGVSRRP